MNEDYKNFVERMGSFDDSIDLNEDHMGMYHSNRKIVTRNRSALVNNDSELKHYGKIGMKWGHHKAVDVNTISKAVKTGQNTAELGQTITKNHFNKKTLKEVKSLSDEDLKKLTNRLNLENNYINAKQQQSGRSKVESILSTTGSILAVAASAAALYDAASKVK